MRRSFGLWLLGLGACYEVPGIDASQVITISPEKMSMPADGFSTVDLDVTLDADAAVSQAITVTVSDGTVNFAGWPTRWSRPRAPPTARHRRP
ncbi:MAG TPA: hypothetical protein VF516_39215 [Kofleriaceae bacterium]